MDHLIRSAARRAAGAFPINRRRLAALSLAVAMLAAPAAWAHEFKAGDITIGHPWSRATPEGAKVAAGYLTLTNNGATEDRLVAVTGAIAGKAEIHEMAVDGNGVMTMREVKDGVAVPAGATVELKPGAFHIMFLQLNQPAKEGVKFKGTLTFQRAGTVDVEFAVDKMSGSDGHDGHGG